MLVSQLRVVLFLLASHPLFCALLYDVYLYLQSTNASSPVILIHSLSPQTQTLLYRGDITRVISVCMTLYTNPRPKVTTALGICTALRLVS